MINNKRFSKVGIVGFGGYLPYWRLRVSQIGQTWAKNGIDLEKSLGVEQKAVASVDEDCLTMAAAAAGIAFQRAALAPNKIGAVFVGSESHPYSVKPTGTILADGLGLGNEYFCADLEFACKAGTTALQITAGLIESGLVNYGLAVGSDKSQAEPGDALDFTASAGAAAFILGPREDSLVDILASYSFCSDTPDFWRREGVSFPSHSGRFSGQPGYFYHLENCCQKFLQRIKMKIKDFDYVVFHMPNKKFPARAAKHLGVEGEQLEPGLLVAKIGNPYSASSLLGLIAVLEKAQDRENILLVSYGSGSGSDAFFLRTKKKLLSVQKKAKTINQYLKKNKQIDYLTYLQNYNLIK